jgi:hypothetical protein
VVSPVLGRLADRFSQRRVLLESMLDEAIFLFGPILVAVLVTTVHPGAGLVA